MKPYYERDGIRVYHGDNREVVPALEEQFAAVVVEKPHSFGDFGIMEARNEDVGAVLETPADATWKGLAPMYSDDTPARNLDAISDLAAGTAGEHLVCADLLMQGYRAFLADQNCPYDVMVDLGTSMIRVQVKTTKYQRAIPQRATHIPAYMWHVRRAGKGGRRLYTDGEFDVLALVALDIGRVAYIAPTHLKQTIHIRPPLAPPGNGKRFEHFPFDKAVTELGVLDA